ncbi:MAG: maleylpyruvate isomerase family mycothiol-dependent enzyme [Actinomycetota bacterium]
MRLTADDYRSLFATDVARMRAVEASDLATPVPHLDGWTIATLIGHTGWVSRFITAAVTAPPDEPPARSSIDDPPPGPEVLGWFSDALDLATDALATTDPEGQRETWAGPQSVQWWFRRLAHETAIHRWDLEVARGGLEAAASIDPAAALDGVDEVLEAFVPRRMSFEALGGSGESMHLHATDIDNGEWMIRWHPDSITWEHAHAKGDVAARGPASDLMLLLWGRVKADRFEVFGDASLLDRWQAAATF